MTFRRLIRKYFLFLSISVCLWISTPIISIAAFSQETQFKTLSERITASITQLKQKQTYLCDLGPVAFNLHTLLLSQNTHSSNWLAEYCTLEQLGTSQLDNSQVSKTNILTTNQLYHGPQLQIVVENSQKIQPLRVLLPPVADVNTVRQQLYQVAKTLPGSLANRRMLLLSDLKKLAAADEQVLQEFLKSQTRHSIYRARTKASLGLQKHTLSTAAYISPTLTASEVIRLVLQHVTIQPAEAWSQAINFRDLWFDETILSPIFAITAKTLTPVSAAWSSYIASGRTGFFIVYDDKTAEHCFVGSCRTFNGWMNATHVMAYAEKNYSWTRTSSNEPTPFRVLAKLAPRKRDYIIKHDATPLVIPFSSFFTNILQDAKKNNKVLYKFDKTEASNTLLKTQRSLVGAALLDPELLYAFSQGCSASSCTATSGQLVFNTQAFSKTRSHSFYKASFPWSEATEVIEIPLPEETLISNISSKSSNGILFSALQIYEMLFNRHSEITQFSCGTTNKASENHYVCQSQNKQLLFHSINGCITTPTTHVPVHLDTVLRVRKTDTTVLVK